MQLLRRSHTLMDRQQLVRNVFERTRLGYYSMIQLRAHTERAADLPAAHASHETVKSEAACLASKAEKAENALKAAEAEVARMAAEAKAARKAAEKAERKAAEADAARFEAARQEAARRERVGPPQGTTWHAFLSADQRYQQSLLDRVDQSTTVALAEGYFISHANKPNHWWNIPSSLHETLDEESRQAARVVIGPSSYNDDNSWWVEYEDGCETWHVNDDAFSDAIRDWSNLRAVALGPDDSWLIVYPDGECAWSGIPPKLHDILIGRQKSLPKPVAVSLGEGGSYFVRFSDGRYYYDTSGLSEDSTDIINKINESNWITTLVFGDNGSWAIRY